MLGHTLTLKGYWDYGRLSAAFIFFSLFKNVGGPAAI
jgi:hypothetical protein